MKFEVEIGNAIYGVYTTLDDVDGKCKKCSIEVPVTKLVSIDEIIDENTMVPVDMTAEPELVAKLRRRVLQDARFQAYCGRHAPESHFV